MMTAKTVYNEAALSLLAKISVRKDRLQCYALSGALFFAGLLFNILTLHSIWYHLLVLVLCLLYLLRPRFYYKKLLKRYLTREKELFPSPRTIVSTFDGEQIISHTLNNNSTLAIAYSAVTTLYESRDYLLLMTEGKQGLPVEKNKITGGNAQELTTFLKEKIPSLKYTKIG